MAADLGEARELGVSRTPAFFLNVHYVFSGPQPFAAFERAIDAALEQG